MVLARVVVHLVVVLRDDGPCGFVHLAGVDEVDAGVADLVLDLERRAVLQDDLAIVGVAEREAEVVRRHAMHQEERLLDGILEGHRPDLDGPCQVEVVGVPRDAQRGERTVEQDAGRLATSEGARRYCTHSLSLSEANAYLCFRILGTNCRPVGLQLL